MTALSYSTLNGQVAIARLSGPCYGDAAAELVRKVGDGFGTGKTALVLDLREVDSLDASMVAAMHELCESCTRDGHHIATVVPVDSRVRALLEHDGLDGRLNCFTTRAGALVDAALAHQKI